MEYQPKWKERINELRDSITKRMEILRNGGDESAIARSHLSADLAALTEIIREEGTCPECGGPYDTHYHELPLCPAGGIKAVWPKGEV